MNKDQKNFIEAAKAMEAEKGIPNEVLEDALKESFRVAFSKKIEDDYRIDRKFRGNSKVNKDLPKLPDALIRVDVNLEKAKIKIFHQWLVLNDDEIQDDYVEMSIDDAKEKNPKIKVGDYYEEELEISSLKDKDISRFLTTFKQKISKAEKDALQEIFKNKIHTVVTGEVEKADSHSVIVNLFGKASTTLYSQDLIGDERFQSGDPIKVYIEGIGKDDKRGSLIKATRSNEGFLEELFKNEIHEIYDGTVEIKKIARIAGLRSKVCVYSDDPNIDASGACIGQNGARIQTIVSQIGNNSRENKEKIDVITYSDNEGLFLAEILRPATVYGAIFDDEEGKVTAIVDDSQISLAFGSRNSNVKLAKKLLNKKEIIILGEREAEEQGLDYKTMAEFEVEAKEESRRKFRERQARLRGETLKVADEVVETKPVVEEKPAVEEVIEKAPAKPVETVEVEPKEEKVVEEVVEETPVETKKAPKFREPLEEVNVVTTTTLESLEKALEEDKKGKNQQKSNNKKKKDNKKDDQSKDKEEKKSVVKMDIYTEEELQEFEDEDFDEEFEDEDYSDYDSDDYYEDN